jgi:uncharacterized protein
VGSGLAVLVIYTDLTKMKKPDQILSSWALKYRWIILACTLGLVGLFGIGIRYLTIASNTRIFYSADNPDYQAMLAFERVFSREQNLFVVVAPKDGRIITHATLSVLRDLTDCLWQIPYVSRIDSICDYPLLSVDHNDLIIDDLSSNLDQLSTTDLLVKEKKLLADQDKMGQILSHDGRVTGINVLVTGDPSSKKITTIAKAARTIADTFRQAHPHIDFYLTGSLMLDYTFGEAVKKDLITLLPLILLVLTVLLVIILRSFWSSIAALSVIVLSLVGALGLAGWLGISLNSGSIVAPVLILTLAVADSVHLLSSILHLQGAGQSKTDAMAKSLSINFSAITITSITTIIGFLAVNFSESPPFRDMGNLVAMGVALAYFLSILFLPALVTLLPIRGHSSQVCVQDFFNRFSTYVCRYHFPLLMSSSVIAIVLSLGVMHIELNDNYLNYLDDSFEFKRATDFMTGHLGGWDLIEYSLNTGLSGGITDPNYLKKIDAFAQWFRTQRNVAYVLCFADIIKELNGSIAPEAPTALPQTQPLTAQYLMLYEMSLPFGHDLNHLIDIDKSTTRFAAFFKDTGSKDIQAIENQAQQWLDRHYPELLTQATGRSVAWANLTHRNIYSMIGATIGALLLISVTLLITLRSLKLGLISLIPNLLPISMAFGIWGLCYSELGLISSVAGCITIGVVVDDTVHFLSKYQYAKTSLHVSTEQAITFAFRTVGTAMCVTTIVLLGGFAVLISSHYGISQDIGVFCSITIALALIMDFFLLPSLLLLVDRTPGENHV